MNQKQKELIKEFKLVQDNTTSTYTPREYAGFALSCGVEDLIPGSEQNPSWQYLEAAKILRKAK